MFGTPNVALLYQIQSLPEVSRVPEFYLTAAADESYLARGQLVPGLAQADEVAGPLQCSHDAHALARETPQISPERPNRIARPLHPDGIGGKDRGQCLTTPGWSVPSKIKP